MTKEDYNEAFNERAAIMEYEGQLPRAQAEYKARRCLDHKVNEGRHTRESRMAIYEINKMLNK
jgi:hypothetical protein